MISPRMLRELSWCEWKLCAVQSTISRLRRELTGGSESDRMTAPRDGEHEFGCHESVPVEPELPLWDPEDLR